MCPAAGGDAADGHGHANSHDDTDRDYVDAYHDACYYDTDPPCFVADPLGDSLPSGTGHRDADASPRRRHTLPNSDTNSHSDAPPGCTCYANTWPDGDHIPNYPNSYPNPYPFASLRLLPADVARPGLVVAAMQVIDGMNTATLVASVAGVLISIHAVAQIFRLLLVMYQREPREWPLMLYWLCVMAVIALTASG